MISVKTERTHPWPWLTCECLKPIQDPGFHQAKSLPLEYDHEPPLPKIWHIIHTQLSRSTHCMCLCFWTKLQFILNLITLTHVCLWNPFAKFYHSFKFCLTKLQMSKVIWKHSSIETLFNPTDKGTTGCAHSEGEGPKGNCKHVNVLMVHDQELCMITEWIQPNVPSRSPYRPFFSMWNDWAWKAKASMWAQCPIHGCNLRMQ